MTIKYVIIGAIIIALLVTGQLATASSSSEPFNAFHNLSDEEEIWFGEKERPAINPHFDPDQDCNIAYEVKCIPGSQQSCSDLEGYHNGEDNVCSPIDCQEGYATADDEETGLCFAYEDCEDYGSGSNYVLIEREVDEGYRCAALSYICDEAEHGSKDYCIEYCKENPDRSGCKPEAS